MAGNIQQSSSSKIADTRKNNNPANLYLRKDENYITIFGWMTNRLKLSGNELLVYALIFSFAKDGASEFHGSAGYIASALNMSRRTVVYTLKSLTDNGLIKKKTAGRYCNYSVLPAQNLHTSSAEIAQVSAQNLHSTCADFSHHIESISKDDSKNDSSGIQKQTTTAFIKACKNVGFSLDRKKAAEILNAGFDPSWLVEPFTYPEYIAEVIQENYADRPHEQKRKLFRTILAAEDRKGDFQVWRYAKEATAAAQEERRKEEAASQGETEPSQKQAEHFISIWTQNPDVFNFTATIKDKQGWDKFWKACTFSESDIDARMENYIAGVKSGVVERLYIPTSPDRFVLDGLLSRSAEPFKKPGRRIANDNVAPEDVSKYFREA